MRKNRCNNLKTSHVAKSLWYCMHESHAVQNIVSPGRDSQEY